MTTKPTPSASSNQRKIYIPEQKLRIVLESFQHDTTIESVRLKYGVAGSVLHRWRDDTTKPPAK